MGRHAVSSPLRTPAVLVGVPVATVLATWSTTAVLGGVVPSAEEAPLRAEAPGEVVAGQDTAVPRGAPSAPAASSDASLLPTADAEPAPSPRVSSTAASVPASVPDVRPASGPRVVRVAPAVAPSPSDGPRVPDVDADDEHGDDDVTPTVVPGPRRDAEPQLAPRAVTAASPVETVETVETVASRSSDETEHADRTDADGSVVHLDTPSGGLSLLTFG